MPELQTPSSPPVALRPQGGAPGSPKPPLGELFAEALPPAPPSEELFPRLVSAVRDDGAFVSAKLAWGAPPPLCIPGLVAREPLAALEQLICIPSELQVSYGFVQKLAPDLVAAVAALHKEVQVQFPEVVTFVAQRLQRLEARGPSLEGGDAGDGWQDATWLDLYLGMQLGSDFSDMPHRQLTRDAASRKTFFPSPEVHNADWSFSAFRDGHAAVVRGVPAEILGPRMDLSRFVQAYFLLLTRTFGCKSGPGGTSEHRLVPVADMLNHSAEPNASWTCDDGSGFVVKATRPIQAGEEVFISYGPDKSNVRLYRTYGFTLPPQLEGSCSFRAWPSLANEVYSRFVPEGTRRRALDLETSRVDSTVSDVLRACFSGGGEPATFLRALCEHYSAQYECDPLLERARARLARVRAEDPGAAVWWREPAAAEDEDWLAHDPAAEEAVTAAEGAGGTPLSLTECAIRVKMSEYVCLTAHIEVLDMLAGAAEAASCLAQARRLRRPFEEALVAAVAPLEPPA